MLFNDLLVHPFPALYGGQMPSGLPDQGLGVAHDEISIRVQGLVELHVEAFLHVLGEVDDDVAAEDHIITGTRGGGEQVHVLELHHVHDLRAYLVHLTIEAEIFFKVRFGDVDNLAW